jgi:hypothetical protein
MHVIEIVFHAATPLPIRLPDAPGHGDQPVKRLPK